ncbi:MAG: hypothetical protein U0271_44080 [Polyangiaceae bacterium]
MLVANLARFACCCLLGGALVACNNDPPAPTAEPSSSALSSNSATPANPIVLTGSAVATLALPASAFVQPSATASAIASASAPAAPATPTHTIVDDSVISQAKNGVLTPAIADSVLPAGAPARVTLLEAGAAPREVISYKLGAASSQTITLTSEDETRMESPQAPNGPQVIATPPISVGLQVAAEDGQSDVPFTVTVLSTKVTPSSDPKLAPMIDQLGKQVEGMKGMAFKFSATSHGMLRELKVVPPANATPAVKQVSEQMQSTLQTIVLQLPDGELGVGAKWQVVQRLTIGIDVLQWTTYTLTKREGTKLELTAETGQLATSAAMQAGGGRTGTVDSFESQGTTTLQLDLTKLLPVSATNTTKAKLKLSSGIESLNLQTTRKMLLTSG